LTVENQKLRRQNQRLQEELRKAEIIIDVQKKLAMLLGRPLPSMPGEENS
jgi:cell shape-determining protein MreC